MLLQMIGLYQYALETEVSACFGILLCITIIGIPWGKQHFKMAGLSLAPFGKDVELGF